MAKQPDFASYSAQLVSMWDRMTVTRKEAVEAAAARIMQKKEAYKQVERTTGVPWQFVAVLHMRECNNDMRGVLHNGEFIIGTGKKTRLVPKGRGPFSSWLEAAVDACKIKGWSAIRDWGLPRRLFEGERFNGWGYFFRNLPSAYLWSGTDQYKGGKFVADGVFSRRTWDPQLGIAPVMKRVEELNSRFDLPASRRWGFFSTFRSWLEKVFAGWTISWSTIEQLQGWFPWPVFLATALCLGVLWLVLRTGERQTIREYREGRYIPSGEWEEADGLDLDDPANDGQDGELPVGGKHRRPRRAVPRRRPAARAKGRGKVGRVVRGRSKAAKRSPRKSSRKDNRRDR